MVAVTTQQEKFLQNIIQGKTQTESYLTAYPNAKKWKDGIATRKASELLRNPTVALRYAELQRDAQEANAITRDSILSHLKKCAFAEWGIFKPADQIRAMELVCKITGVTTPRSEEDFD